MTQIDTGDAELIKRAIHTAVGEVVRATLLQLGFAGFMTGILLAIGLAPWAIVGIIGFVVMVAAEA
jgi:hypothetical protein